VFLSGVEDLRGSAVEGSVAFTWAAPLAEPGDVYVFQRTIDGAEGITGRTDETTVMFTDIASGREVCLDVVVTRSGSTDSASRKACVTA